MLSNIFAWSAHTMDAIPNKPDSSSAAIDGLCIHEHFKGLASQSLPLQDDGDICVLERVRHTQTLYGTRTRVA